MKRTGWRVLILTILGGAVIGGLAACATIMQGTTQTVGVSSSPPGARVTVDAVQMGVTPLMTKLARKDNHVVRLELDGYEPFAMTLTRGLSGWVAGNIIFGGLIGLAIDAASGGMYKLTPDQLSATLTRSVALHDNALFVTVVLTPDPAWERIGTLARE
jgi:hypothetical protein